MERGDVSAKSAREVRAQLSSTGNPLSGADAELLNLLEQWDVNGDGQYSVAEVLLIARHFQQKQRQVTNLKRTLCFGLLFTLVLLAGILFVACQANEITKDMRPSKQGILTTTDGKLAGVAAIMRRGDLDMIPNMTDHDLAELQYVSFGVNNDTYTLKVAGVARRATSQGEYDAHHSLDLFFVGGPFANMNFGHDIKVFYHNDTSASEVVAKGAAGERRRLQSLTSSPWAHIGSAPWAHIGAGVVGLSGTDAQVASAPWTHIR
jgi:hypothetical protein